MEEIKDRPLSPAERQKLHPSELEVVRAYERITGLTFMRFELSALKGLFLAANSAQIIKVIAQMRKTHPQNFIDFHYIVRPVTSMFKNKNKKAGK